MHGSHWQALLPDLEQLVAKLHEIAKDGVPMQVPDAVRELNRQGKGSGYFLLRYPDTPVQYMMAIHFDAEQKSNNMVSCYPFLRDGIPNTLELLEATHEDEELFSTTLECVNSESVALRFFDPLYCQQPSLYQSGAKYRFSLAALAYMIEPVVETMLKIDKGPMLEMERRRRLEEDPDIDVSQITHAEISIAELRALFPREEPADAEFQTVVEEVDDVEWNGGALCRMRVKFTLGCDEEIELYLYASEPVLHGYSPRVGDSVRGVLWLQGYPLDEVHLAESWTDSVAEVSALREQASLAASMAAQDQFADEHIGIIAFVSGVAGAGFELTRYRNPDKTQDAPIGRIEVGEQVVDLWARSFIENSEPERSFTPQQAAECRQMSEELGHSAVFVTIKCKEVGEGYEFSANGMESLTVLIGEVRMPLWMRKPAPANDAEKK